MPNIKLTDSVKQTLRCFQSHKPVAAVKSIKNPFQLIMVVI